jgi:uncharacterized protein YbjT (DUF2867 family)
VALSEGGSSSTGVKIFITGATGFVGREVASLLSSGGHSIRILARNPDTPKARDLVSKFNVEVHTGDVTKADSLRDALRETDAVIHLVGIISEMGNSTFENIHTRGTENMVRAAQQQGAKRFVHMSALGTRPNAISRYHRSKWAAEECVRASGLDITIFRPSLIYGAGDGFVNLFARIIRLSPIVPVPGRKDALFAPLPVKAVTKAFVRAATERAEESRSFDLCGQERLTLSQIIDGICSVLGKRRFKVHVPNGLARFQATLLEWFFPAVLRQPPPLNRDQLLMLQEDNVGDPQPAQELFGLTLPEFKEGISTYLAR